jgi:hypothetical protein
VAVIRGGRQGIITVKLGDQAIHAERAAAEQLGPAYANYISRDSATQRSTAVSTSPRRHSSDARDTSEDTYVATL